MIHVLTLSWNGLDKLERLKNGLFENLKHTGETFHWFIRDNGSVDATAEAVATWSDTTLLKMSHNRDNFAQGMNSLIELSKSKPGDMFLFLNNDIDFGKDNSSLTKMVSLMKVHKAKAVGARLLYPDGTLQHAGVIFGARYGNMPYHYRHKEKSDDQAKRNRKFQAVTAAVCLVDAGSVIEVGNFNTGFNWAFEDIDLALRLGKLGPIMYCGDTNITHEESASLKKNPVNKLFLNSNVKLFKDTWFGKYEVDHDKYLNNPLHNVI